MVSTNKVLENVHTVIIFIQYTGDIHIFRLSEHIWL